jgi:hypothetical protein
LSEVVPTELELVPEAESRFHQVIAIVVGVIAVVAALLAILEADSHRRNDAASAGASRAASDLFAELAASGSFQDYGLNTLLDANALELESTGRILGAFHHPSVKLSEGAIGLAGQSAAAGAQKLARQLAAPPTAADGVDPVTAAMVGASTKDSRTLLKEEQTLADRSRTYGSREQHAILGLSLAASAAALLGLAGLVGAGRPGRVLLAVASLALLGAVVAGATAFA